MGTELTTRPGYLDIHANPYVGPRAFREGEQLPNREREALELAALVIGERIVLLHSPSGAGKTSLIQSAVMKILAENDIRSLGGVARVGKPPPSDIAVHNRYIYSLALHLLERKGVNLELLATYTLQDVLDEAKRTAEPKLGEGEVPLLIIDQFEEVLTLDPTDCEEKTAFFKELGEALAREDLWALFAMREDYMGGLERYRQLLPGHLRARYRLDFLTHEEAQLAIQTPAGDWGVEISDTAAQVLVNKLAMTKVSSPNQQFEWLETPYVEPFQLQIVCQRLWSSVSSEHQGDFHLIDVDDMEKVDIEGALSGFYGYWVRETASATDVAERTIREWFETQLITPQGYRSQTVAWPVVGEKGSEVLRLLEDAHLIRGDSRAQTTWYELVHDRLITAVLRSNELWRSANVEPWRVLAHEWQRTGRPEELLLPAAAIRALWPLSGEDLADYEAVFRQASLERAQREGSMAAFRGRVSTLSVIALAEAVVIAVLVTVLLVLWI